MLLIMKLKYRKCQHYDLKTFLFSSIMITIRQQSQVLNKYFFLFCFLLTHLNLVLNEKKKVKVRHSHGIRFNSFSSFP